MPADNKKIAKNALMLYLRMGVATLVGIYTSRVILQNLGITDYGIYNVVGGIIGLLSFITAAIGQGIQRFYNYHKGQGNLKELNNVFSASIVIMLIVSCFILIMGETIGVWFLNTQLNIPSDRILAANWVFQCSILMTIMGLMTSPYNALINAYEDFGIYAYVSIITVFAYLGVAYLVSISPIDTLIFYALLCTLVVIMSFGFYYIIVKVKYKEVCFKFHRNGEIYKSLLGFSGWNMMGVASYVAVTTGMNMVLNIFFGPVVNAARGIAIQISSKVDEFVQNVQSAAVPQIIQLYSRNEHEEVRTLVDNSFKWNFSLFWFMSLPIMLEIEYILDIWLTEVPAYTSIFTNIILIRSLLKCFEKPINTLNFAVGKVKNVNIFSSCCTFFAFFLAIILFKLGLPPYWGFITDIFCIVFVILYNIDYSSKSNVYGLSHFFKKIFWRVATVISVSTSISFYIHNMLPYGFSRFIIVLVSSEIISIACLLFILYSHDERCRLLQILKTKFGYY